MMPLVSVVMPVFNAAPFLRAAVDSILRQTLRDLELIVVDDGSTDDTSAILGNYTDSRLVVERQIPNRGIATALNRGCALAAGTYLARMDADDEADPARLERQAEFLARNPGIALVGTQTVLIDGAGAEIGREDYPTSPGGVRRRLFVHNPFAHGSVMMRTSVLRECGGYRPEALHNEDYDLWLRILARREGANLPEPLLRRRLHGGNISTRREAELVRHRLLVLAHAAFHVYRRPAYAVFLARPAAAYLWRVVRGTFRP